MKKIIMLLMMMMLCVASSFATPAAEGKVVVKIESSATNSKAEETQWVLSFDSKVVTIKGVKYTLKGNYQVYRGAKGGLYILIENNKKYYLTEAMKKLLK